jgi:hypothetical protein
VTVEGHRAKPSKVSNEMTLQVNKVNDVSIDKPASPWIQIRNVDSLPKDEPIIVEGYEFISWRGAPEINWHVESCFMITKVVSPQSLKLNALQPQ